MTTPQMEIRKLGMAIACLLSGAIAPALQAQDLQYTKPKDNVVQAQPHRAATHYYKAKSKASPDISAVQLTCPPGMARNSQGHCYTIPRDPQRQPGPAHRHVYAEHSNLPSSISAMHPACPPGMFRNSQGRCVTIPRDLHHSGSSPGLVEHHASGANSHGIIFVGGKRALNPQPIPPGHAVRKLPRPGAPVENPAGH